MAGLTRIVEWRQRGQFGGGAKEKDKAIDSSAAFGRPTTYRLPRR